MDFGSLLNVAHQNSRSEKKAEVKYYSTKYAPPKKESKDKKLSSNIQKFLAKKEIEDREKMKETIRKREQLLASRDTKAKNKILKMLKVTKSANKSVIDDAVDHDNTAFTLDGPDQPDEDDYGYVSQEASELYSKLMAKYKAMPEEKKFSTGNNRALSKDEMRSTKDRVRAAIMKEQEDELLPHRRQRQSTTSTTTTTKTDTRLILPYNKSDNKLSLEKQRLEEKPKPKIRKNPPPPAMDFQQLLKLAEQKQHEPIEIEVAASKKDSERLMTSKERRELEEKRAFMEAKDRRQGKGQVKGKVETVTKTKMEPNGKIPKLNGTVLKSDKKPEIEVNGRLLKTGNTPSTTIKNRPSNPVPKDIDRRNTVVNNQPERSKTSDGKINKPKVLSAGNSSKLYSALTADASSGKLNSKALIKPNSALNLKNQQESKTSIKNNTPMKNLQRPTAGAVKSTTNQTVKSKPIAASGSVREFPPRDLIKKPSALNNNNNNRETTRQFPPSDMIRKPKIGPSSNLQKKPNKRRILDDDEDYDSEMDDFIDDGPEGGENYSKYISEIFGYDKNRYRDEDYDDRQMESTFAQQMREEFISKKIGIMEDLEDMRLEALEKQGKSKKKRKISD